MAHPYWRNTVVDLYLWHLWDSDLLMTQSTQKYYSFHLILTFHRASICHLFTISFTYFNEMSYHHFQILSPFGRWFQIVCIQQAMQFLLIPMLRKPPSYPHATFSLPHPCTHWKANNTTCPLTILSVLKTSLWSHFKIHKQAILLIYLL